MASRLQWSGKTALITGAASGIGHALALNLAGRGCHLALADRHAQRLDAVAKECQASAPGLRLSTHVLDVADRQAVAELPQAVTAKHPEGLHYLFNNAGVALNGTFEHASEADFDWVMEINFHSVVRMTRAFLPLLRKSQPSHIINISSLFGIIALPEQAAYCASKFAVRGFSHSLQRELEGSGVGLTVVHPGGVATRIARDARMPEYMSEPERERQRSRLAHFEKLLVLPPERAAAIIVDATERRKARVLVGRDAKIMSVLERLWPVGYWALARPKVRKT